MPWANLDDHFHDNPKVLDTPLPAVGLYAIGLSYCNAQLSDGFIPRSVLVGIQGWAAAAKALVEHRFWEPAEGGGYRVHDYLDWNPSREQRLADRAAARERKARSRDRRPAGQSADVTAGKSTDVTPGKSPDVRYHAQPLPATPDGLRPSPDPPNPLTAAAGADGAAPRAAAESPVTLHHDGAECPICRLPYTGPYLEHTAAKHKVNREAAPGNLFGARHAEPEVPPPDMQAQFAAMHQRLQSLPDQQKQA